MQRYTAEQCWRKQWLLKPWPNPKRTSLHHNLCTGGSTYWHLPVMSNKKFINATALCILNVHIKILILHQVRELLSITALVLWLFLSYLSKILYCNLSIHNPINTESNLFESRIKLNQDLLNQMELIQEITEDIQTREGPDLPHETPRCPHCSPSEWIC